MTATDHELPFDTIVLLDDGASRRITLEDLEQMRLNERITAILENRLVFLHGEDRIDLTTALKALRALAKK